MYVFTAELNIMRLGCILCVGVCASKKAYQKGFYDPV